MIESALAYSNYREEYGNTERYDELILRSLDRIGRGRKDYMIAKVKQTSGEWYSDMANEIIIVARGHRRNTENSYFWGAYNNVTQEWHSGPDGEADYIARRHLEILEGP